MSETQDHNDDRALAGEYALGLLAPEEVRAFEGRLANEPALAALVRTWHENFAELSDEVVPVAPAAHVRKALEARLFGADEKKPWFGSLRGLFAAVAVSASLVVAAFLISPDKAPDYIAEIAAEDASLVVAVAYFENTGYLELQRKTGRARDGRSLELWLIAGDNAPISLGVMPETERNVISLNEDLRALVRGAVLAVTDEPEGGSPTGLPTGEVVAAGTVSDA